MVIENEDITPLVMAVGENKMLQMLMEVMLSFPFA
jgi:hypothetical protein